MHTLPNTDIPLPQNIAKAIGDSGYSADTVGCSGAKIFLFDSGLVLKAEMCGAEADRERDMLLWLEGRLAVPHVVEYACEGGLNWLLTTRLPGKMSCDSEYLRDPLLLAGRLAEAFGLLWQVDVSGLPVCATTLSSSLALARTRLEAGLVDEDELEKETLGEGGFPDLFAALAYLEKNAPAVGAPVFCHGDCCLPNIFIDGSGVSGFLDLGRAGTDSIWRDLALCVRSLRYNLGEAGERCVNALFDALGIAKDAGMIRYYILLDEFF